MRLKLAWEINTKISSSSCKDGAQGQRIHSPPSLALKEEKYTGQDRSHQALTQSRESWGWWSVVRWSKCYWEAGRQACSIQQVMEMKKIESNIRSANHGRERTHSSLAILQPTIWSLTRGKLYKSSCTGIALCIVRVCCMFSADLGPR